MARLQGYAVKISWLGADHTYVLTSDGGVYGCWGRSAGGRLICSHDGSSAQANCISQTDSHAGIVYGVTGVCHQTANRILWPARVAVSGASGYWASTVLYGVYGTSSLAGLIEWEARRIRCSRIKGDFAKALPLRSSAAAAAKKPAPPQAEGEAAFLKKVDELYSQDLDTGLKAAAPEKRSEMSGKELELILDFRLGASRDQKQVTALKKIQSEAVAEKDELAVGLMTKKLNGEEYADKVNTLATGMLNAFAQRLSDEEYVRLFNLKKDVSFALVDPKIMRKYHK